MKQGFHHSLEMTSVQENFAHQAFVSVKKAFGATHNINAAAAEHIIQTMLKDDAFKYGQVDEASFIEAFTACNYFFRVLKEPDTLENRAAVVNFVAKLVSNPIVFGSNSKVELSIPGDIWPAVSKHPQLIQSYVSDLIKGAWYFSVKRDRQCLQASTTKDDSLEVVTYDPAKLRTEALQVVTNWVTSALAGCSNYHVPSNISQDPLFAPYSPTFRSSVVTYQTIQSKIDLVRHFKHIIQKMYPRMDWTSLESLVIEMDHQSRFTKSPFGLQTFEVIGKMMGYFCLPDFNLLKTKLYKAVSEKRNRMLFFFTDKESYNFDFSLFHLALFKDPSSIVNGAEMLQKHGAYHFNFDSRTPTGGLLITWQAKGISITVPPHFVAAWEATVLAEIPKLVVNKPVTMPVDEFTSSTNYSEMMYGLHNSMKRVIEQSMFLFQYSFECQWTRDSDKGIVMLTILAYTNQ